MAKKKNSDPHRPQHIAWRDGQKKEIVMNCLNHPSVLNEMPEDIRGNAGEMVLWGCRKLRELGMSGRLDVEPSMFSNKPEEVKNLESRIEDLERALYFCQTAIKTAAVKIRMPGYNPKIVIDDCLKSVVANSPKFMGETVPTPEEQQEG
jgi:hypothetical protein